MSALIRDPKLNPLSGDVLQTNSFERQVLSVKPGCVTFREWHTGEKLRHINRVGSTSLTSWKFWSRNTEVIKRGA